MALRHHERNFATGSAHTLEAFRTRHPPKVTRTVSTASVSLEANISHDTTNHPTHQGHAAFTPACFTLPSGTQTHFPPRPRKSQWRRDITNVVSPHGPPPTRSKHDTTNHPAHQRHAAFTPACFALPSGTAPHKCISTKAAQISMALRHHERNFATWSAHTLEAVRTRRPPKVTRTVSKTSVSYETSKSRFGRAFRTRLFLQKSWLRVCKTSVSYETSSKSHVYCLQNERFARDFLQKSHVKSAKRAFRTRLPPKVTRQVCKTSVSYETSSKSHTSCLQNEGFVRDLLKNSHVKVCKLNVSHETSSKSQAEHHAALPSSFAIPAPPNNTRSHAKPNVTATFTSTTTHNLTISCACHESFHVHMFNAHKVLRLPRNVTNVASVTPRNFRIPCACYENLTSTPQNPHKVLRLPRKVTISYHVSFNKICTTPHVWNDFDPF